MEFWLSRGFALPTDLLRAEAELAEEFAFDGLMLNEHIVSPPELTDSRHPYGDRFWDRRSEFPDPWVTFGHLSASTSRVRFCTSVAVLACHETFAFARSVATAARLSGNRVMVGVGAGWLREDYLATGHDFAARGSRTDEMLGMLSRLWAGETIDLVGPDGRTQTVELVPPLPTSPVPMLYGGISRRGLNRAAGLDGWIGVGLDLARLQVAVECLRQIRSTRGLADRPFQMITSLAGVAGFEACRQAALLGVTGLVVSSAAFGDARTASAAERRSRFEAFAGDVMAPLRAGP
jgi:alkanesulfonate monooxygenase SsuD/methylene tetrahydromethanopterin reductase-like flavin-dependent oxidoreductase (luciferase family)